MDTSTASAPSARTAEASRTTDLATARDGGHDPRLGLFWVLRIACACEFIGHGAFGIITKREWVPYFGVAHIHPQAAYHVMPVVGGVDIMLGILTVLRPCRAQLLYMAAWGLWTAALRPLSGESGWEMLERAPNVLVPLSLLVVMGFPGSLRAWFMNPPRTPLPAALPTADGFWQRRLAEWTIPQSRTLDGLLRLASAGAFIGHGAYGVFLHKPGWLPFFARLGFTPQQVAARDLINLVGGCEMLMGVCALALPVLPLLAVMVLWKFGTELMWYPLSGKPIWEVVERASNYAAPLGVLLVHRRGG
jgi:hypothetical protein